MSAVNTLDDVARGLTKDVVQSERYEGVSRQLGEVPAIMQSMMPSGVRVLDVGCGPGSVTIVANADKGNQVLGLEPDDARATIARGRGLDVLTGYLDEAFVASHQPFDVVMSSDVLEHTVNPASFLALIKAVTKPSGILILSVPNVAHWSIRANLLRGRWDYSSAGLMDATHLRWFTQKTLTSLLTSAGFSVERLEVSAGSWLPEYHRKAWKFVPAHRRAGVVRRMVTLAPTLFGCQLVVKAIQLP